MYRTLLIHFFSFTAREGSSQDFSKTFARAIVNVAVYLRLLDRLVRNVQEKLLRPFKFVSQTVDQTKVWFRLLHFRFVWFANMLSYGVLSFLGGPFPLKTLLEESIPAWGRQVRRTVEFAGKHLYIRRSRKQRNRCWLPIGNNIINKHSNDSYRHWFLWSSVPLE